MICEGLQPQLVMFAALIPSWLIGWAAFDIVRGGRRAAHTNAGALLDALPYVVGVVVAAVAFAALLDDFVLRVCSV